MAVIEPSKNKDDMFDECLNLELKKEGQQLKRVKLGNPNNPYNYQRQLGFMMPPDRYAQRSEEKAR